MSDVEGLLRREDLVIEDFGDAMLIWDEQSNKLHHLDTPAALVWDALDGRPIGDVTAAVAEATGLDVSTVRDDVITACERLRSEGLLRS